MSAGKGRTCALVSIARYGAERQKTLRAQKADMKLQSGRFIRPQKAVIYGPEGVGKSTLASQFPSPVFLDTEGGTHHLDVIRFGEITSWEDVTRAIAQLTTDQHEFKTLIVDTADWLEKWLTEWICQKANKNSIEDFGYGKGYVILGEEFAKFLASLDGLLRRGMHVVLLAHSTVRKFESPEQAGGYDRYELKLSKQVGPLVKEWADLLLFANYVTKVAENENGKKRGVGGKERAMFTSHAAAYDAKNRHGLPEKLPMPEEAMAPALVSVFGGGGTTVASILASMPPAPGDQLAEVFKGQEDAVRAFLVNRGQLKTDDTWADVPLEYATRILSNPARFMQSVAEYAGGDR